MSSRQLAGLTGTRVLVIWLGWTVAGVGLAVWQRALNLEASRHADGYIVLSLFSTVTWTSCALFALPPAVLTVAWLVRRRSPTLPGQVT